MRAKISVAFLMISALFFMALNLFVAWNPPALARIRSDAGDREDLPSSSRVPGKGGLETGGNQRPEEPEKDQARLKAREGIVYDAEKQILVARGGVELTYRNIRVRADRMQLDVSQNVLIADGNVVFNDQDQEVRSESLTFNLDREEGSFGKTSMAFTSSAMRGKIYVKGRELASNPKSLVLKDASFTTCDLPDPHYHLEAREVKVYLDDRIEARNVSYWEGKWRLFVWPFLVIPIKEQNAFEFPRFGYSKEFGWFVKTTYNYYRNSSAYGSLYLDYYQLRGFGAGIRHNYKFAPAKGWLYLYALQNKNELPPDLQAAFSLDQEAGSSFKSNWQAQWAHIYPAEYTEQADLAGAVQLTGKSAAGDLSLRFSGRGTDYQSTLPSGGQLFSYQNKLRNYSSQITGNRQLTPDLRLTADVGATRYESPGRSPYDHYEYGGQLQEEQPAYRLTLAYREVVTPPLDRLNEAWQSYRSWPEVKLESKRISVRGRVLPLQIVTSYGQYHEEPGGIDSSRVDAGLRLTGLSYPVGKRVTLGLLGQGTATYYGYADDDLKLMAELQPSLTYRIAGGWTARLGYTWQDGRGDSPFAFDAIRPKQELATSLNYAGGPWSAEASANYDLLADTYRSVGTKVAYQGGKDEEASLQLAYNPYSYFGDLAGSARVHVRDRLDLKVDTQFSLARNEFYRADNSLRWQATPDWRLELATAYDGFLKRFYREEVGVVRSFHCREVGVRYNFTNQEIWLELRIKAFPSQEFRMGAGETLLVDANLEGFENAFSDMGATKAGSD